MNPDLFKKLTEEARAKLVAALGTKEIEAFVAKTKAATDSGRFKVVVSTDDVDRQGEIVSLDGWDFANFKANPVVLFGHDYYSLPIGVCDKIGIEDIGGGKKGIVAEGIFAPEEANPFAQQVRRLYDLGILRTTSVGFIAKEMVKNTITKAELLEFSFVPVPANPYALSLSKAKELGIDVEMLGFKGLKIEVKADPQAGDVCTMDDGTEGIITDDGEGHLVCMMKKAAEPIEGDACKLANGEDGVIQADGNGALVCMPIAKAAPTDPDEQADSDLAAKVGEITVTLQGAVDELIVQAAKDIQDAISAEEAADDAGEAANGTEGKGQEGRKVGRVLSEKTASAIQKAIDASEASTAALKELLTAANQQGDEGKDLSDGTAPKKRSIPAGSIPTFDEFQMGREVLKEIATLTGEALERFKKANQGKKR